MTTQDKYLIGAGVGLVVIGGYIYYNKLQKAKEAELVNTDFIEQPAPIAPPLSTTPIVRQTTTTVTKPVQAVVAKPIVKPTFKYSVGQYVMANLIGGVQTQNVIEKADGNFATDGENIKKFSNGEKIGKIIWAGIRPNDGGVRYVVRRDGSFSPSVLFSEYLYWVNHDDIAPIPPLLKKIPLVQTTTPANLNMSRLLYKGIYDSPEVEELQRRLGVAVDGDFGTATENALMSKKGVKKMSLNQW